MGARRAITRDAKTYGEIVSKRGLYTGNQEPATRNPIVVQGAMPSETDALVARLERVTVERAGGWTFWRGEVDGYPVIVSRTLKGMENAGAATAIAVERFHPAACVGKLCGSGGGREHGFELVPLRDDLRQHLALGRGCMGTMA